MNLPYDYPRPAIQSFKGRRTTFELSPDQTRCLKELALENGGTLYMVLLAVINIWLSKLSRQQDIIVGAATAGRPHNDLRQLVGMFVNTLALRNYPQADQPFNFFLQKVKANTLEAFENQDYPFEKLVDNIMIKRDTSRNPLFDIMFVLQNIQLVNLELPGLLPGAYNYESNVSRLDLTLIAVETDEGVSFVCEYCNRTIFA